MVLYRNKRNIGKTVIIDNTNSVFDGKTGIVRGFRSKLFASIQVGRSIYPFKTVNLRKT